MITRFKLFENIKGSSYIKLFENKQNIIINDDGTGLMISNIDLGYYNWDDAITLCKNYNEGGYDDWKLPTKEELNKLFLNKIYVGGFYADNYWTSSEYSKSIYWTQYFSSGYQANADKKQHRHVRAIRYMSDLEIDAMRYNL